MSIRELNEEELMEVSGGFRGTVQMMATMAQTDMARALTDATYRSISAAVGWLRHKAPGGADEGTWTNIGHSGMGA